MAWRLRLLVVVAWIGSLVGVGAWAGARVRAVAETPQTAVPTPKIEFRVAPRGQVPPAPVVYAGQDLGFRVDSDVDGVKRGTLVIRVDGTWVEARFAAKVVPVR